MLGCSPSHDAIRGFRDGLVPDPPGIQDIIVIFLFTIASYWDVYGT